MIPRRIPQVRVDSSGDGGELTQFQATFPLDTLTDCRCNKSKSQQIMAYEPGLACCLSSKVFFFFKQPHSFLYSFTYCLWMLLYYNGELSTCDRDFMASPKYGFMARKSLALCRKKVVYLHVRRIWAWSQSISNGDRVTSMAYGNSVGLECVILKLCRATGQKTKPGTSEKHVEFSAVTLC